MATLILQTAGSALGTALGGPIGGAVGRILGAGGGALIDGALFGTRASPRFVQGPRLSDVAGLTSTEGDPIPRVYGRARIGGTLIWATRPLEVANTAVERSSSGAKGGGGQRTVRTTYAYYAHLAVGLCEGEIAFVRRVWADGNEIDLTAIAWRLHTGGPDQAPDPLIVAKEGADRAPAYRGLAYMVFERLPLADYGNRVPQFAFEVIRPVDGLGRMIRAVELIPGSTEFGLDPAPVTEDAGFGATRAANRYQLQRGTDVLASLDALQALCPRLTRVAVVTAWFGDDLRAGRCTVVPKVDSATKTVLGKDWSVAGLVRGTAGAVSTAPSGGPAYGGTPSDAGLTRLVAELHGRGLAVVLYPFVMMDVPAGNVLPDPHAPGAGTQPAYPWRGRITCDPAPGLPGSPDATAEAGAEVAAFFDGPSGYAAMVLHYADLAAGWAAAGTPLSGFFVGSEFVGLTRVRDGSGAYPAVTALRSLAAAVRARLGTGVKLVYAADWTEYGAHVRDGGATIRFPLDDLFADPAIDAVGIDYYPPLTDWRDGASHADLALADSITDAGYLKSRLGAGEAFDWYYPDSAARAAQARTPITDGAYGKPWIHRPKDLVSWWSNPHVERDGGVETRTTPWVPRAKPVWLTEIGVPAVDKGTNGPNVFPDPKSSENAAPPFSTGLRDDLIQLRGLEAILSRFDPDAPGFEEAHNPVSPLYGGRMVPADSVFVWCWDARPYPAFPDFGTVWADAGNWSVGHWITGRVEGLDLARLIPAILSDLGVTANAEIDVAAFLDGYVLDRALSARGALEPLAQIYGIDVSAAAGRLLFRGPRRENPSVLAEGDLVRIAEDEAPLKRVRAEESALPSSVELGFSDGDSTEYRRAAAAAIRPAGSRRRETRVEGALVTRRALAEGLAEALLDTAIAGRDTASFSLSPRRLDLEPGDLLALPDEPGMHRVTRIEDGPAGRRIETRAVPVHGRLPPRRPDPATPSRKTRPAFPGPPFALALDLPADRGDPSVLQYLAVAADPWPGEVAVWRSDGDDAPLSQRGIVDYPACLGRTLTALGPGPLWRFDRGARLDVTLRNAAGLASVDEAAALAGANLFALVAPDGGVELLSAAAVTLTGADSFRLGGLLRGLAGSEAAASRPTPAGSLLVRLDDGAVVPLVDRLDEAGRAFRYRIGPASRDPADPAFTEIHAGAGLSALLPMSPVHLRARRGAEGIRFTWIRRARRAADAWEPVDIPLDEVREGYVLDVLGPDGAVLRSFEAAEPSVLYAAADEIADFGGPQTMIAAAVAQVGAAAGRGPSRRATLRVGAA
ncbi:baseplate multidomain protein megatron [Methylobacterium sp. sgz302541]|uniref:baseplate multidomain protein megatron n=1 Tax=unclassified Methylobacterium TaxID=2615210 RepID=UPI003D3507A3